MASKIKLKKQEQGYKEKQLVKNCGNCALYISELIEERGSFGVWEKEVNIHCGIGGFKVKKTAICDRHELKTQ